MMKTKDVINHLKNLLLTGLFVVVPFLAAVWLSWWIYDLLTVWAIALAEKLKLPVVLKKNLTAQEIREFSIAFRGFPEVRLEGRFERDVYNHPAIHELIGKTAANDRKAMVGISGLEQKHDLILSGKSGRLTVMLDRNGSWIYETLRITRQPENGRDLKLEQSLQELVNTGDRNGK